MTKEKEKKLEAIGIWLQAAGQGAEFDAWMKAKGAKK